MLNAQAFNNCPAKLDKYLKPRGNPQVPPGFGPLGAFLFAAGKKLFKAVTAEEAPAEAKPSGPGSGKQEKLILAQGGCCRRKGVGYEDIAGECAGSE